MVNREMEKDRFFVYFFAVRLMNFHPLSTFLMIYQFVTDPYTITPTCGDPVDCDLSATPVFPVYVP